MTRFASFLLGAVALAGCSGLPGTDRAAFDRGGAATAERADRIAGVRFVVRTGGPIRGRPLVHAGSVFFGSGDGRIYAVDARTGVERWHHQTGGAVASSLAASGALVYAVSRDGELRCLGAGDGVVRWRHRFGPELGTQNYWDHVLSSPTVRDGRVYVGAGDGTLVALGAADGALLWRFDAGARIRSTPAVQDGIVVVGTMDGRVIAVDAASGALRWSFATEGAGHTFADQGNDTTSVFASPTIAAGRVSIGGRDGQLYALDLATGRLAWRSTHDGSSWILATAFDAATLYVASGSAMIVQAADPATGSERWRFRTRGAVFSSLALARDTLLFSDFAGVLYAVDSRSGAARWQFPLGSRSFATPALADGIVYAGADNGVLLALDVAPEGAPPLLPSRRIVYWEGAPSAAAYSWFRNGVDLAILGQLKGAGYEQMNGAALAAFVRDAVPAREPSVVVFADNRIPDEIVDMRAGPAPLRRYLEAGGKVVLLGSNPVMYKTDRATGAVLDIDPARVEQVFGVRQPEPAIANGYYANRPTAVGIAAGLRSSVIAYGAVEPHQGDRFVALALDEYGKAGLWLQDYGGRPGSGLLQLAAPRQETADLAEMMALIEHGIGW